jgi:hypothetical protein
MPFPMDALIERSKQIVAAFVKEAAGLDRLAEDSIDPERSYYLGKAENMRYMILNEQMRLKGLERVTVE